jgi:hypothetical protein
MNQSTESKLLAAATGGAAPELAQRLLLEVTGTLGLSFDPADEADDAAKAAAALQMMRAAAPRDPLEAMLAAQMTAVHGAAMRALRRAAECGAEYPQIEALYARQAARLTNLFMRQMEALERRRGRAQTATAEARNAAMRDTRHDADAASAPPSRRTPHPEPVEGCASGEPPSVQAQEKGASGAAAPPGDTSFDRLRMRRARAGDEAGHAAQAKRNGSRHRLNGAGPPQ